MKVLGLENLQRSLRQNMAKHLEYPDALKDMSVAVGYTAGYALYVHENIKARHQEEVKAGTRDVKGKFRKAHKKQQAKFLEQPTRELNNGGELSRIVTSAAKGGVKMQQALYLAGLRIQGESQEIVPVDTGNLRGSAFTQKE